MESKTVSVNFKRVFNQPRTKRAQRMMRTIKEEGSRHAKIPLALVKLDAEVNAFVWKQGGSKLPRRVHLELVKDEKQGILFLKGSKRAQAFTAKKAQEKESKGKGKEKKEAEKPEAKGKEAQAVGEKKETREGKEDRERKKEWGKEKKKEEGKESREGREALVQEGKTEGKQGSIQEENVEGAEGKQHASAKGED